MIITLCGVFNIVKSYIKLYYPSDITMFRVRKSKEYERGTLVQFSDLISENFNVKTVNPPFSLTYLISFSIV